MAKLGKPDKGTLLISEPFLADPNFKRTVVLLTEHNDDGTVGFILNRPLPYRLNEIMEDFPELDAPVYVGGPVQQDSLHFIHRIEELAEEGDEVVPGVYWGGNFEKLKAMAQNGDIDPENIRFFVGYSGWGPKQLEGEMRAKTWIMSTSQEKVAFAEAPKGLWHDILSAMGGKFKMFSNYPEDPSFN